MKRAHIVAGLIFLLSTCGPGDKPPVVFAGREAPLGQVVMQLYADGTFSLENRNLRGTPDPGFQGTYVNRHDTLFFHYQDSVPWNGCDVAILTERFLSFDGCLGSLEIHTKE